MLFIFAFLTSCYLDLFHTEKKNNDDIIKSLETPVVIDLEWDLSAFPGSLGSNAPLIEKAFEILSRGKRQIVISNLKSKRSRGKISISFRDDNIVDSETSVDFKNIEIPSTIDIKPTKNGFIALSNITFKKESFKELELDNKDDLQKQLNDSRMRMKIEKEKDYFTVSIIIGGGTQKSIKIGSK